MSIEFIVPMNVGNGRTPMSSVLSASSEAFPIGNAGTSYVGVSPLKAQMIPTDSAVG